VRPFAIAAIVALALSITGSAAADEKDPRVEACAGKSEGATCAAKTPVKEEGKDLRFRDEPGTCQAEECCELDYSQGSPPKSVCAACLSCKPGAALPPPADGGNADGGDVEPPRSSGGDEPPATSPGKKGCAIGGTNTPSGALVLLVIAAISGRATRRQPLQ
jgi:hypothetical protein